MHPIAAVQNEYSLWTREPEIALLDECRRLNVAFVAFSPLARGFLTCKIRELNYARGFSYSDEGQLIGHINIGMGIVTEKLCQVPGFPPKLRDLLFHMILSHHGEMAFGSPKVPMFAEALLLHHLDNLDSKMEHARAYVERDRLVEGFWTSYSSPMDRSLLVVACQARSFTSSVW